MNKTYVLYIGTRNVRSSDIGEYVEKIVDRLLPIPLPEEATVLVLPTDTTENRLECIDPVYITDENLIFKHNTLLAELNMNIKNITNNE